MTVPTPPELHGQPVTVGGRTFTAQDIEEDHACRSQYLRHLTGVLSKPTTAAPAAPIPLVIVQFWDDSARIPTDVQECMTSWVVLEDQGFRREVYDDNSARTLINFLRSRPTMRPRRSSAYT
ncbi:hypothetical protein AB0F77_29515 [Streptomyces sp. NPDC026672]|uniref:hypothetical protein n=1 Tax=unclassified Streptomyces TaxID=2593676 RepID=UPI0034019351